MMKLILISRYGAHSLSRNEGLWDSSLPVASFNFSFHQVKAVFALKHLLVSRSANNVQAHVALGVDRQAQDLLTDDLIEKQVLPILVSVMNDRSEHPEVRMAAIGT